MQVYETMTNLEAVAILDLLNKPAVQLGLKDGVSFGKPSSTRGSSTLMDCWLVDGDLAGVVALVTHPEMAARGRSLIWRKWAVSDRPGGRRCLEWTGASADIHSGQHGVEGEGTQPRRLASS